MRSSSWLGVVWLALAAGLSVACRTESTPRGAGSDGTQTSDRAMARLLDRARDLADAGKHAQALALVRQAVARLEQHPQGPRVTYDILDLEDYLLMKTGAFSEALQVAFKIEEIGRTTGERKSPWDYLKIADAYLGLGDRERALDFIEKAVREREFTKVDRLRGEHYAQLRSSLRFQQLLAGMEESLGIGRPAKDFRVTLRDGSVFTLSTHTGKVVLIDFWDVRCLPCRRAMPHLRQLHQRFASRGLVIVGISLDTDRKILGDFLAKEKLPWVTACSFKGWGDETAGLYRINSTPSTWLVDRRGDLRAIDLGGDELSTAIEQLL